MLKLKLKETLQERGVLKPFTWLKTRMGFNSSKATKLLNGKQEYLTFQDLDTLCQVLECTPNDLFYYMQDGRQQPIKPDHPLHILTMPVAISNWNKILKQFPPKKLAEMAHSLNRELEKKE